MQICLECHAKFKRLSKHIVIAHGMLHKDYIVKHEYNGRHPKCACGCNTVVTFAKGKFKKFIRGHASRVDEIKKIMIEGGRSAAADPIKRKKNSEALILRWKDATYKQQVHAPENKLKRLSALRIVTSTKEFSEKLCDIKKTLWQNKQWAANQRKIFKSDEYKNTVSKTTKLALSNENVRKNLSERAKEAYTLGKRKPKSNWSSIKSGWYFNPYTNNDTWFDSMWEYDFLISCHDAGLECIREPFIISYKHNNTTASYFPDFLVENTIVEIKGRQTQLDDIKHLAAIEFAINRGYTFVVLKKKQFNDFIKAKQNEKK
jgi:hypothetical protein